MSDASGHYQAGPGGLKRHLTILFSDLSDSTELCDAMEAEDFFELLGQVRAACRDIITRHGGRVARLQGDGLLAVFGFPQRSEDDGRRATEAALDLRDAVAALARTAGFKLPRPLALHSGIHAGLTYVQSGSTEIGSLEVLGDPPNSAARLSSRAKRGEILVSEETLGAEVHFFETAHSEVVSLRGRAQPLAVCSVLRRLQVQRRFEARAVRGLVPFVGRDAERATLHAGLAAAQRGDPRCFAVLGGPGLGKTRLVEELLHTARSGDCTVLHGYCESYLSAQPLQPFVQVLRGVLGLQPDMPQAQASATAQAAMTGWGLAATVRSELLQALSLQGAESDPKAQRGGAIVPALAALVDRLASERPVLLVLDDWQWADELSQRVLDAILKLQRPLCVLIASRTDAAEGVVPASAHAIELQPLRLEDTHRTLAHLLPDADPFVIAEIHRYAGGVPLFIEELSHATQAQRWQRPADDRVTGAAWLAALVESRVERLPALQRHWVTAAAVIGTVFPLWLLEQIMGGPADAELLKDLAQQDLIFPSEQDGMLRFKHGVTRDVIYDAVGLKERMAIHGRVGQALLGRADAGEREDALPVLAYHLAAAGEPQQAARFAEQAGDKAMAAFALDQARALYAAALKALDAQAPLAREQLLQWCAIAEKLGMACVFDPLALAEGVALFERGLAVARATGDVHAVARAEYWLGYLHYSKGQARRALGHCEAALALATQIDDLRLAAQVRATLGQALSCAGRYDEALNLLDTALVSKRSNVRPGSSIAVGSAFALATKGSVLGDRGEFTQAEECFAEALALLGDSAHQVGSSVRMWISAVYQWQGRWEDAERMARGAERIAEHCKSRQLMAMSRALLGHAQWMLYGQPANLKLLLDATGWIEARKGGLVTSLNYGWLVQACLAQGQTGEARRHAVRLFQRARALDRLGEATGCRALALAAGRDADFERAERYLARARHSALLRRSRHETAANALASAELAALRGQRAQAAQALDAASQGFEALAMPWHRARAEALRRQL